VVPGCAHLASSLLRLPDRTTSENASVSVVGLLSDSFVTDCGVGVAVAFAEGDAVGVADAEAEGEAEGRGDGDPVGVGVGVAVGVSVGVGDGVGDGGAPAGDHCSRASSSVALSPDGQELLTLQIV